jgi:energy-coupling factor transporter ATP-binding protein EcfA2
VLLLLLSSALISPVGLFVVARLRQHVKENARTQLNLYLLVFFFLSVLYTFWRLPIITEQISGLTQAVITGYFSQLDVVRLPGGDIQQASVTGGLTSLAVFWAFNSPMLIVGIAMWHWFEELWSIIKPRTLTEQAAFEEERWKALAAHGRAVALQSAGRLMPEAEGGVLLGMLIYVSGQIPKMRGVVRVGPWIGFSERLLDEHIFILGSTGSGKTETIKQLINGVAQNTERDIIFVDGKGDKTTALEVQGILYKHGRGVAPIFRLGDEDTAKYNAFSGDALAISNRLAALVGVEEAEGNALIYAARNRRLLKLICNAKDGPPRSFRELEKRINLNWLKTQWDREQYIDIKDADLKGLRDLLQALVIDFSDCIAPDGFRVEQTRAAIFSLRTSSYGDTGRSLARLLIEDIKDYVGNRQERPALLIIDEFGQFGTENIIELLSLARSSRLCIVLATQTEASLGDELTQEMILGNTMTKILHRVEQPEKIAGRAGTRLRPEVGAQIEDGKMTGMATVRWQHQFVVPMNVVRELADGQAFIVRHGQAVQLQVKMVLDIPQVPKQDTLPKQLQKPVQDTTSQQLQKSRQDIIPPQPQKVVVEEQKELPQKVEPLNSIDGDDDDDFAFPNVKR